MTEPLDPPPTPNPTLERMAREAHELRLMERAADTMEQIFNHIACGGTLSGLCEIWQVRWYKIRNWIYDDDDRLSLGELGLSLLRHVGTSYLSILHPCVKRS